LIRTDIAISAADFTVGDERTVYEWCMIYSDRHPGVATLHATTANQKDRLLHLGAIATLIAGPFIAATPAGHSEVDTTAHYRVANAVYQELATAIQSGSLEPKRRAYLEDRPGELDPTLCVLEAAPILAIAERRGDYGGTIRWLLIAREVRPGPKAGAWSAKNLACQIVLSLLEDETKRPPRGRGRLATLAGMVNAELTGRGHQYKDDSVRKMIGHSVREWEEKHPEK
jgi:hypothetical protein